MSLRIAVATLVASAVTVWGGSFSDATSGGDPYDVPQVADTNPDPGVVETTIVADETEDVDIGGVTADLYTFNGTVPGPEFRLTVGQRVIVHFENALEDEASGIHWHGIELSNPNDGTPLTQNQVQPGGTFQYDFVVTRPGVFWYHPHHEFSTNHVFRGLYGSIIVTDPNEAPLIADGTLPGSANTRTLVLSDITVCKSPGGNDAQTYDPALPWVGGGALPNQQPPTPTTLCDTPLDEHGDAIGAPLSAGEVPNIQKHGGRVNEGQTVITNGVNVGGRAGSPTVPGALAPGAETFSVQPGGGVRLQLVNAATTRFFRLRLTGNAGQLFPLLRVGGEAGLLDAAVLDGTAPGGFNFMFDEGEILIGPGDRADVVAAIPSGASGVATLWTEDFQRTGNGDLGGGWTRLPTVPVAHMSVSGSPVVPAFTIGDGTPLRGATGDPVELLPPATGSLLDPATLPTPQPGTADPNIRFTANGSDPSMDDVVAVHDFTVDYTELPHSLSSRFALLGDTLELTVSNSTLAAHPFHLHGFSIQPLSFSNCTDKDNVPLPVPGVALEADFVDEIIVPGRCTLTFRVRLEDRPFPDGTPGGGVGRWVIHCHIFFHHHQGMETELVVIDPESLKTPTTTTYTGATSGFEGQPATMSGTLVDATDNSPIAGETLTFELEGAGSCSASTGLNGVASCAIIPKRPRGVHDIAVDYDGSDTYQASSASASFYVIVPVSTGRATAVDAKVPLLSGLQLADTGPVESDVGFSATDTVNVIDGPLFLVRAAEAAVLTGRGTSLASSSVGFVRLGGIVPAIQVRNLTASSSSSCTSPSSGRSTVASLSIGGIQVPTVGAKPNTAVTVLGLRVVLNEQVPFTTADGRGLSVNALRISGPGVDVRLGSATSDIHQCEVAPDFVPLSRSSSPSTVRQLAVSAPSSGLFFCQLVAPPSSGSAEPLTN